MAFGAAGALGGLLGPPLKEYEGETYEWSYSCCGSSCKGEGELVAVDSQTLAWRDVKGSFVPASAKLDASRDAANVHHFVTDDGSGVWVFGKPGKPLKFYSSSEAATSGGAPTVTAMIRTSDTKSSSKGASSSSAADAAAFGILGAELVGDTNTTAGRKIGRQAGDEANEYDDIAMKIAKSQAMSIREQKQQEAKEQREQEAAFERAEIAEKVTFARQKDREKAAAAARAKKKGGEVRA